MKIRQLIKIAIILFIASLSSFALSQDQLTNYNPFFVTDEDSNFKNSRSQQANPIERGCGSGTLAWGNNEYQEIPGIYWAYIKNYCNNGIEITIWTDFTTTMFGSNSEARLQGREITDNDGLQRTDINGDRVVSGFIEANAKVQYDFTVNSNGLGKGYINDVEYDLHDGTLFLIATNGNIVEVRQVEYNLASIGTEDITLLATRHPEITEFFEEFHANFQ